jgi:hypothetical protein
LLTAPTAGSGPAARVGRVSESPEDRADEKRIQQRAELLPEEESAGGSDDPEAQAAQILRESDERTQDPSGTRAESTQTLGHDDA